jgi:hypothetical protein
MPSTPEPPTVESILHSYLADQAYRFVPHERLVRQSNRIAASLRDQWPILQELAAAGFDRDNLGWFVNTRESYVAAIPVLLAHLRQPHLESTQNSLVRALTVKEARGIVDKRIAEMLAEFVEKGIQSEFIVDSELFPQAREEHSMQEFMFVLSQNLSVTASPQITGDIEKLLLMPRLAPFEKYLLHALKKSKQRKT